MIEKLWIGWVAFADDASVRFAQLVGVQLGERNDSYHDSLMYEGCAMPESTMCILDEWWGHMYWGLQ